ncbi:MAG: polysaccharide biosynthesis tyrosine autokinase [Planctomycetota bacterium]
MPRSPSHLPAPHTTFAQQRPDDSNAPWTNPWAVFWRRKTAVLGIFLLGSLATILLWRSRPEVYRSSAQMLLIVGAGSGEYAEPTASVQARTQSHMAQLKNPLVVKRVVRQVFDTSYPEDSTADDASERLALDHRGSLIKMSFAAASPELSQTQLAEIISGYQGYLHYTPQHNHRQAIDQLQQEIRRAEQLLHEHQQSRISLLTGTPFAGTKRDIHEQIDERLRLLNDQRKSLQVRKAEIERALASQPAIAGDPQAVDGSVPTIPELGKAAARDLYALELRQRMMQSRARVMRPELQRASNETNHARQLYSELGRTAPLLGELTNVEQSIEALDTIRAEEQRLARQWQETATQAGQLQNAISQQEQIVGVLRRQRQRRTLANELETCRLQVIAPPKPGLPRSLKSTLLYQLLPGILGSLVLGILIGCALEFADRGFHSPSEIPRTTGAPLVGELPFVTPKEAAREHSAVGGLVANYKISHSDFADQFRRIRTALLGRATQARGEVLLVASANRGDGRSVGAANLAAAIAQAGKRTLLIDANMRCPQLHETFGATNRTGLSDILAHSTAWQKLVEPTLLANVDLLTSGQPTGSPTELLSSPHWIEFLESVRPCYDYLVLDSPAIDESLDARVLARSANQILMLVTVGRTSRSDAQFVVSELGELSRRISGVIVNNVRKRRKVWRVDPWENYHRMHTQVKQPSPARGPDQPLHAQDEEIRSVAKPMDNRSGYGTRAVPALINELAADARQMSHNLQQSRPPNNTPVER